MNRRSFLLGILGAAVAASPAGRVAQIMAGPAVAWSFRRICARCGVDADHDPSHQNGCPQMWQELLRALETGNYNAAPSKLVQGAGTVVAVEDLSPVMAVVTFEDRPFYRSVRRKTL